MTNDAFMQLVVLVLCVVIGAGFGYRLGRLERLYRELLEGSEQVKPEEAVVTSGVYDKVNESNTPTDRPVGISEVKTPQQLAWEEQERLRKEALHG